MRVTTEHVLGSHLIDDLYETYLVAFGPLRTKAAARHLLTPEEFAAQMTDGRLEKHVVWDEQDQPVALTTLTCDVSAIPWVSREFYASRYPDAAKRGALFYLGYVLVDTSHRRSLALLLMSDQIDRRLAESQGVLGFDLCGSNNDHGIGRHARRLLRSSNHIDLLDTQAYYAADYRAPASPT